jgi:phage FluMu protein Com
MGSLDKPRELLDKQQCARGHPKCEMVEVGHSRVNKEAYLEYQCPTCDRKLKYSVSKTGVEERSVRNKGKMEPE